MRSTNFAFVVPLNGALPALILLARALMPDGLCLSPWSRRPPPSNQGDKPLIKRAILLVLSTVLMSGQTTAGTTLIANGTILTLEDGADAPFRGYLLIDGASILDVGSGSFAGAPPDRVVDADGRLVMPGFVSGHSHLWQSAFRGLAADGELYPWLQALHWTYGSAFGDGDFHAFTLHGALDQLSHGITTTYNHSQRLGATEAQYLESLEASLAAGQHLLFAYNADLEQTEAAIRRDVAALVARSEELADPLLLGLSLNSVGSYGGDVAKFALEMTLARQYGMTAQIHYLEQFSRRFVDRRKWPDFLAAGAVADNVSYAHFIHTTERIVADSARLGAAMIWNPLSNGRLASGMADIPRYLEAGIAVGMGVDGAASADIADPFENMRMGMYGLRMIHKNANVMLPLEVLRLHTLRTAEVLRVDDRVGSLTPGKRADVLIVDPAAPPTGAVLDPAATLVLACSAANIAQVWVAGELLVERGVPLRHDMAALQRDVEERVARILARAER